MGYTTRAGQIRTSVFDSRDCEIQTNWSDSTPDITRTFDAAGRVLSEDNGTGTGSKVEYNPNSTNGGVDDLGSNRRTPETGLAHELGHSSDIDSGKQSFDRGRGQPGTTPPSERGSMKAENDYRRVTGQAARSEYYR